VPRKRQRELLRAHHARRLQHAARHAVCRETTLRIDREICVNRVQRTTEMNAGTTRVTRL
jgi:hypothetical protein